MAKPKICKWEGCQKESASFPNSTIKQKYCTEHAIQFVLQKKRLLDAKNKQAIDDLKKSKKTTPADKFYQTTAWKWCSKYVLLHYADDDLMVQCCTSGLFYKVNDQNIHCGHYHKADRHKATAFEFKNLAPQSASDNTKKSGLPEVMAKWIERTHGEGTLEWLDRKKNETCHLDKYELDKISEHYKALFDAELIIRGISNPWK